MQIADFRDQQEVTQILNKFEHVFELLGEHARHEDNFIFPEIEKAVPGSTRESVEQHREYEEKVDQPRDYIRRFRKTKVAQERIDESDTLNRAFTNFMAFYPMHTNHEEETALPATLEKCREKNWPTSG